MAMHPMQHLSLLTSQEHAVETIAMQIHGSVQSLKSASRELLV